MHDAGLRFRTALSPPRGDLESIRGAIHPMAQLGRGISQRVKWLTRNVGKWFCSGRALRQSLAQCAASATMPGAPPAPPPKKPPVKVGRRPTAAGLGRPTKRVNRDTTS